MLVATNHFKEGQVARLFSERGNCTQPVLQKQSRLACTGMFLCWNLNFVGFVVRDRRAGADQIAVAKYMVETAYWWPVFVLTQ